MMSRSSKVWFLAVSSLLVFGCPGGGGGGGGDGGGGNYTVIGYSELGMHCMNEDFSELMILPPYNNLRAQVIQRGEEPRIVTGGVKVAYSIPGNTHSSDKTNFWTYVQDLLGVNPAPDVGLTGNGLAGTMVPTGANDWVATGIPLTPLTDAMTIDPYQLGLVSVVVNGQTVADTRPVVSVSWEISCDFCHTGGTSTANDILHAHDVLHGTTLESHTPVTCGDCHAQTVLGLPGNPALPSLSSAMHLAHASRMSALSGVLDVPCYACHPGVVTQCQRDVHYMIGMDCTDCHVSMTAVGDPSRTPWVDEPRCMDCHARPNFQFEQPGKLFRESKGHHGVHCAACHGSPHAITPTVTPADNVQAKDLQGHSGTIDTCTVCHTDRPDDGFNHTLSGD